MTTKNGIDEEIVKRLNIIISLLLEKSNDMKSIPMSEKISRLIDMGVSPTDIAKIVGKPLNYVTATASQRKSRK